MYDEIYIINLLRLLNSKNAKIKCSKKNVIKQSYCFYLIFRVRRCYQIQRNKKQLTLLYILECRNRYRSDKSTTHLHKYFASVLSPRAVDLRYRIYTEVT